MIDFKASQNKFISVSAFCEYALSDTLKHLLMETLDLEKVDSRSIFADNTSIDSY